MSETLTVKRDVDIQIYEVRCHCGSIVDFDAKVDYAGDIYIKINNCPDCEKELEEAKEGQS